MKKRIQTLLDVVAGSVYTCFAEQSPPPNVVMILSDDQGYADYSFMGHAMIDTPRIDRLA